MRFGAGDETGEGGEGRYLVKTTLSLKSVDLWSFGYEKNFLFFSFFVRKINCTKMLVQDSKSSERGNAELW